MSLVLLVSHDMHNTMDHVHAKQTPYNPTSSNERYLDRHMHGTKHHEMPAGSVMKSFGYQFFI